MKTQRPLQSKDVVRINGKDTGVVNRLFDDRVNVFVTQNNPYGIGVWFDLDELKRIGRVKKIAPLHTNYK